MNIRLHSPLKEDFCYYTEDRAIETASIQTKPTRLRVEGRAVKITLFS